MDYYYYDDFDSVGGQSDDIEDASEDYDSKGQLPYMDRQFNVIYETCIQPSVIQIASYVLTLIGWSLLCRIIWTTIYYFQHKILRQGHWIQHLTSILCGFGALYFTTGFEFLIVVFFSLMAYVLMLMIEYHKLNNTGFIVAVVAITSHFLYEGMWHRPEAWQKIRGIQMIATMKIISFAFDLDVIRKKEKSYPVPTLGPYLGYLFSPATCVLGPWIPFSTYLYSIRVSRIKIRWILWTAFNATVAIAFLCLSNCIMPLLNLDKSWQWFQTYTDALSVRCSHYFICFLSQATLTALGSGLRMESSANKSLGFLVTKPWAIEFPRSLSSVVRCWNIPMHDWLKTYVFRAIHLRYGCYWIAILSTYLVSSLLHGFHMKVYMVLLSLGTFAYIENILRAKLAIIYDACITANPCRTPCHFKHCSSRGKLHSGAFYVALVNLLFSLLAVFHLAYLGIMMNSAGDDEPSLAGLEKWSKLSYLNHWIALTIFLLHKLI